MGARKKAKEAGEKYYSTGKPCAKGHLAERLTSNGGCVACSRAYDRDRRAKDPEAYRLAARRWKEANKERVEEFNRKYYLSNREELIQVRRTYARKNLGACNAKVKKYKMGKEKRTPAWLSDDDIRQMSAIYQRAAALTKETGIKHHVDHIIPLRGKNVSGLHVPSNLQILTAQENLRKSNSFMGMQ